MNKLMVAAFSHTSLIPSRGVIFCRDVIDIDVSEIKEELRCQNVIEI